MASMIGCLDGIDTSKMTLKEISAYLFNDHHIKFTSSDGLRKSIRQHGLDYKKSSTRKYDYESFYVAGMGYVELAKLSSLPKSCAYQWIRTMKRNRLKVEPVKTTPKQDIVRMALNGKWC